MLASFFALAEGGALLVGPLAPEWQGADRGGVVMVGHPDRLWGMGEGVRQNGGTTATISPIGLREPIPESPRPPGRQRLVILGDSSFFGHGVGDDETLGAQLQAALRADGVDADVLNGAIPGYSTEQSLMLLDDIVWDLDPTLLLIGNLWSDNNFDLYRDVDLLHTRRSLTGTLASRSAFMRLLAGWLAPLRSDRDQHIITWTRDSEFPTSGIRRVLVGDYARNLDRIIREAAGRGVGAALLGPSNRDTATDGRTADQSWSVYFEAQALVQGCQGVPWIDTLPAFQGALAQGATLDDLFIDEMHPTTRGQALMAGQVLTVLGADGWPARPLTGSATAPCDVSSLKDPHPDGRSTQVNQLSPQSNLFPSSARPLGPQGRTVGGDERLPPGAWLVSGTVDAESWPVRVTVRDVEGRSISSMVLGGPGEDLRVVVFNGLDRVLITAIDGADRSREITATPEAATLALDFTARSP